MEKNQELIYDCVRKLSFASTNDKSVDGVTASVIADKLNLQRTNVSAILNKLSRTGKLKKIKSRPVKFTINESMLLTDPFESLIGSSGSLKNAIQLTKAAILYPNGNLNINIQAAPGSGTSIFVDKIINFAEQRKILDKNSPRIIINCRNYSNDPKFLDKYIFGPNGDFSNSCFEQAKDGLLFINHFEFLEEIQKARIADFLDNKIHSHYSDLTQTGNNLPFTIFSNASYDDQLQNLIPINIKIPSLKERSLNEKMNLISLFFQREAVRSNHTLIVSSDVLKSLLLSNFKYNIKQLATAITMTCANAYVRFVNEHNNDISIFITDLDSKYRKSLLLEKENKLVLYSLLENREKIIYSPDNQKYDIRNVKNFSKDLYDDINKQYESLIYKGINGQNIKNIISSHISKLFSQYSYYNGLNSRSNINQLSKIVDPQIIGIVTKWLSECSKILDNREFGNNVLYGLCLHINSLLNTKLERKNISYKQTKYLIKNYPAEYKESVKLAQIINDEFGFDLPIEEIVLIMLFLIEPEKDKKVGHPVVLYIIHGKGTASSLMETTDQLNQSNFSYAYDMDLDEKPETALLKIKDKIKKINQGKGVIVIYDMGSIKVMLDTIGEETRIKIRPIQVPITLIGIDAARKSSMETDVDYVYNFVTTDMHQMFDNDKQKNDLIITLCHTGEGGAKQLKNYIDEFSHLGIKTKAMSMGNKTELIDQVINLKKIYQIHAFVGTFDPKLFGIPFISIDKIFENSHDNLDKILMFKPIFAKNFDYDQVYKYFRDQFRTVPVSKLKQVLPDVMDKIVTSYNLNEEQRVGLFVHLGSMIERVLSGAKLENFQNYSQIIENHKEDYKILRKALYPIEKTFKFIINDSEIATILLVVNKM